MHKLLTVVIPMYNVEKYAHKCLSSFVLADKEKMSSLEVLCINDGSPDHSSDIAKEYQSKYPDTFRVIDKQNGNYGSCINRGLKEAKGKYFKVCDGDDFYNTEALGKLIDMLGQTSVDMVISSYQEVDEQGEVKKTYELQDELLGKVWSIEEVDIDRFDIRFNIKMHCLTTRTELLRQHGYKQTEGISYTDNQLIFYSCLYAQTLAFFKGIVYCYRLGVNGQTVDSKSLMKHYTELGIVEYGLLKEYNMSANNASEAKKKMLRVLWLYLEIIFSKINFHYIKNSNGEGDTILKNIADYAKNMKDKYFFSIIMSDSSSRYFYLGQLSHRCIYLLNRIKDPLLKVYFAIKG